MLDKLPAQIGVSIVPVAFKEGSRLLTSYILCGNGDADKTVRWMGLHEMEPTGEITHQCAQGPAMADQNTIAFSRTGLKNTPTLMTAAGVRFEGDVEDTAAVMSWVNGLKG